MLPDFGLVRTHSFIRLPAQSNEISVLDSKIHSLYGSGPDPVEVIDETKDEVIQNLSKACLFARKQLREYLFKKKTNTSLKILSSNNLLGLCGLASSCFEFCLRMVVGLKVKADVIFHQAQTLFPEDGVRHMFLMVKIGLRTFLVDLSMRQFLNEKLYLTDDEKLVCDLLLTNGFIEFDDTDYEHILNVYRRLINSFELHRKKEKELFLYGYNELFSHNWVLSQNKLEPVTLDSLLQATSEKDHTDQELMDTFTFSDVDSRVQMVKMQSFDGIESLKENRYFLTRST